MEELTLTSAPSLGPIMTPEQVESTLNHTEGLDNKMRSMLMKKVNILARIHPSDLDKLIQEVKMGEFKMASEFNLQIAKMAYERKTKALQQLWNAELTVLSMTLNGRVVELACACYAKLTDDLHRRYLDSCRRIDQMVDEMNTMKYPPLRERYEQSINKLMEQSLSMYDDLIANFVDDLKSKKIVIPETHIRSVIDAK